MCVGLVLLVFAILLLRWCCLDRENEWIVQHGARYLNGVYWAAGLRGGAGRFNIARIALKWRKADTTREENPERAEDAEKSQRPRIWTDKSAARKSQGAHSSSRAIH